MQRLVQYLCAGILLFLLSCATPFQSLQSVESVAVVALRYDPTVYMLDPKMGVEKDKVFAAFTGTQKQRASHDHMLNGFLVDLMTKTIKVTDVRFVRPLKLLNTSLLTDTDARLQYEYLLDPYDPINIDNHVFMAGLAKRLKVDAVADVRISFALYTDDKTLWDEYKDPYENTSSSYRLQLREGHKTSLLRTTIAIKVVNTEGDIIYNESRFVDVPSEDIDVTDTDLAFPGGVSPKFIEFGLDEWLRDWVQYITP
jgi:hypothetical protein